MAQQKKTKRKGAADTISSTGVRKSASKLKLSQATLTKPSSKRGDSSSKAKASKPRVSTKKRGNPRGIITTIVIVVFAVVMALAMMLPSFATVFASSESSNSNNSTNSSSDNESDSDDDSTTNSESVDGVFSTYSDEITSLESKLSDDPDNLAYLYNVGKEYMDCAYSASQYASGDTDTERVDEYYQNAMDYFDRYLALNDSDAVKVDRALCQLYKGDTSSSIAAFEQITTDSPDYGPAWANLGLAYETSGDTTSAINAYNKAKETDPDNEYGAYSYAVTRLNYIQSEESSSSNSTDSSTTTNSSSTSSSSTSSSSTSSNTTSSTTGVEGLSNALSGNTTSSSE